MHDLGVNRKTVNVRNLKEVMQCDARLVIEKDNFRKIIVCKYYGTHTCVLETKWRVDKHSFESVNNKYPNLTHESIVRQGVQSIFDKKNYKTAVELSQKYTDKSHIDNIRKRTLLSRRSRR